MPTSKKRKRVPSSSSSESTNSTPEVATTTSTQVPAELVPSAFSPDPYSVALLEARKNKIIGTWISSSSGVASIYSSTAFKSIADTSLDTGGLPAIFQTESGQTTLAPTLGQILHNCWTQFQSAFGQTDSLFTELSNIYAQLKSASVEEIQRLKHELLERDNELNNQTKRHKAEQDALRAEVQRLQNIITDCNTTIAQQSALITQKQQDLDSTVTEYNQFKAKARASMKKLLSYLREGRSELVQNLLAGKINPVNAATALQSATAQAVEHNQSPLYFGGPSLTPQFVASSASPEFALAHTIGTVGTAEMDEPDENNIFDLDDPEFLRLANSISTPPSI